MEEHDAQYWNDIWLQYQGINQKKVERCFKVFNFYALPKDSKILDIGCGSGESLRLLKSKGFTNLHGIEPEKRLFERNNEDGMIQQGNCLEIDHIKEQYDIVMMLGVLHHLHNMEEIKLCLRNIKRVLKPGGKFYSVEQWKNIVRSIAMKLVRDTPVGKMQKTLRIERELLKLEQKELGHWLEVEKQATKYAEEIGLKVILAKKDLRCRYIIFEKVAGT
jgi:2-polyprenyl-3-methyl-5-hydroxy-6-metoxy-1,4-benzoquinol methylase